MAELNVATLTLEQLDRLMRQLEESALEIATLTAERDSARQQSTVNAPPPTYTPAHSEEPIVISFGTPTQNDSMGQRSGAASEGAAHSMPGMERNRTAPSPREPRESRRHVEFAATSGEYVVTAPMPLKPQRPPCFDLSQRGGPTVQSWVFTMNVFSDTNYIESDAAKIRYAVSLLRGPAMDWWRVISPESSTVHVNAITMKRAVAAGADVYAVDIAIVEEADKPSDFQKLLAAVPSELQELLKRFPGIFLDDLPEGLPPQRAHDHRIELEPGAQPTVQRQFRLTQPELDELRKQLDYLLEKKFIRPSSSPFAAPILFTPKRDGGFRMCIDYRALNRVTVKSRYPIPRADERIDQLRTARVFSKIDLRGGYHQIRVEPSDCAKTAFRTRYGSFEYTVMPFGLTNAPATFQMTMNEVFRPHLDKCVIIYLDDILVNSRDKQQHLEDLEAVFTILDKHRLLTKISKCEFFQDGLEFLGHVISEAGVEIDPKKLDTVKAWHPPTNITELQSFLGFVNYVRQFVPDMARLTAPLTDLLRKGVAFTWGEKEHAAFSTLKNVLCSPPVLRIADPHRPFEVVTDASDIAIGAVLLQDFDNGLQPIAYESRKLHPPEKNYPIHDPEMLAIMHAFKLWRCYLAGADVTVRTDHKSLQYLRAQPHLNPRQIRWLDYLESNFHYTVTYKKGASNIADALTRPTAQRQCACIAMPSRRDLATPWQRLRSRVFRVQEVSTLFASSDAAGVDTWHSPRSPHRRSTVKDRDGRSGEAEIVEAAEWGGGGGGEATLKRSLGWADTISLGVASIIGA
ncbi:unnamed protein product, partial [Closterium sp. NIES-54]